MSNEQKLTKEVLREMNKMQRTVEELHALVREVGDRPASIRYRAAASQFLADFYMGVENILKRIAQFQEAGLPDSATWHADLLDWFCDPTHAQLPALLDTATRIEIDSYRRFRHVAHHGYALDLEWNRMKEGIEELDPTYQRFRERVVDYLEERSGRKLS
jgi:hypothetical protein